MITYPHGVGGATTRIIEEGDGSRLIVLIHGLGGRADRWVPILGYLADSGYRVIAIDLPGHGFGPKGDGPTYTVPGFAKFIEDYLQTQSAEDVTVVGTSLGGHVAALVACNSPHLIKNLIMSAPTGMVDLTAAERARVAELIRDTSRPGVESKLRAVVSSQDLVTETWIEEEYRINNSPGASRAFDALSQYFRESINYDTVGDRLSVEFTGPILYIWGAADRLVPSTLVSKLRELVPASALAMLDGLGHAPYLEDPPAFSDAIIKFLNNSEHSLPAKNFIPSQKKDRSKEIK